MVKIARKMIVLFCFLGTLLPFTAEPAAGENSGATTRQGYQVLEEAKFREAFQHYLGRRLGKKRSDIAVSKFKVNGNKAVPVGKVGFQLFQKDKRRLQGNVRLIAVVRINGKVINKVTLSGWVDVFDSVVCAARNLKRGQAVTKDDVYLTRKNISHLKSNYLTAMNQAIGLMVKHNIKVDACIKNWMLKKLPVVDRGDLVTILAESAGLKLTVPGRVLKKGYDGELVKVKNLMSKRDIYAKVVDNATVMVDF
jgi:flagella basal body P-ring formation protein FlgA